MSVVDCSIDMHVDCIHEIFSSYVKIAVFKYIQTAQSIQWENVANTKKSILFRCS